LVNVGLIGDAGSRSVQILRSFVQIISDHASPIAQIVKADLAGDPRSPIPVGASDTRVIHISRVVFRIGNQMHTIFAPNEDERPLIQMGIVTVSRIARIMATVFSLNESLDSQLGFFSRVRFIPRTVVVAFTGGDLLGNRAAQVIEAYKNGVRAYFELQRHVDIAQSYFISEYELENAEGTAIDIMLFILSLVMVESGHEEVI